MQVELLSSLAQVAPEDWDALTGDNDPFVEHAFLNALETSGSVGAGTGWLPVHVTLRRQGRLVGALPLYLKEHSYGEYIFDFSWAAAAERAGLRYYPKLVSMVPFTPATGRRFLFAADEDPAQITAALLEGALAVRDATAASSIHLLFLNAEEHARVCTDPRFMSRLAMQFHWHNTGVTSFEQHLSSFRSVVRKEVRKERRRAAEAGLDVTITSGPELSAAEWQALSDFYFDTCDKHGSGPYLTRAFFSDIAATHAKRVVAALAKRDGVVVAGTLNFEKGDHLYGRYWGSHEELPNLHFELCYHRLIERAIERGYSRFEAGAQGTHKLRRGLLPAEIYNACHIAEPRFALAIGDFLAREAQSLQAEMAELRHHGPSHREL
jgi:predicted N-acyltransferase